MNELGINDYKEMSSLVSNGLWDRFSMDNFPRVVNEVLQTFGLSDSKWPFLEYLAILEDHPPDFQWSMMELDQFGRLNRNANIVLYKRIDETPDQNAYYSLVKCYYHNRGAPVISILELGPREFVAFEPDHLSQRQPSHRRDYRWKFEEKQPHLRNILDIFNTGENDLVDTRPTEKDYYFMEEDKYGNPVWIDERKWDTHRFMDINETSICLNAIAVSINKLFDLRCIAVINSSDLCKTIQQGEQSSRDWLCEHEWHLMFDHEFIAIRCQGFDRDNLRSHLFVVDMLKRKIVFFHFGVGDYQSHYSEVKDVIEFLNLVHRSLFQVNIPYEFAVESYFHDVGRGHRHVPVTPHTNKYAFFLPCRLIPYASIYPAAMLLRYAYDRGTSMGKGHHCHWAFTKSFATLLQHMGWSSNKKDDVWLKYEFGDKTGEIFERSVLKPITLS